MARTRTTPGRGSGSGRIEGGGVSGKGSGERGGRRDRKRGGGSRRGDDEQQVGGPKRKRLEVEDCQAGEEGSGGAGGGEEAGNKSGGGEGGKNVREASLATCSGGRRGQGVGVKVNTGEWLGLGCEEGDDVLGFCACCGEMACTNVCVGV